MSFLTIFPRGNFTRAGMVRKALQYPHLMNPTYLLISPTFISTVTKQREKRTNNDYSLFLVFFSLNETLDYISIPNSHYMPFSLSLQVEQTYPVIFDAVHIIIDYEVIRRVNAIQSCSCFQGGFRVSRQFFALIWIV